jgi:hypothetical protein
MFHRQHKRGERYRRKLGEKINAKKIEIIFYFKI